MITKLVWRRDFFRKGERLLVKCDITQIWVFVHITGYNSACIGDMSQNLVPVWGFRGHQQFMVIGSLPHVARTEK